MESKNATFQTPGHVLLSLRVPTGEIALETYEGTETFVELRVGGGEETAREVLERARIEIGRAHV